MRLLFILICLVSLLLPSCGFFERHDETSASPNGRLDELRTEVPRRQERLRAISDPETGWPSATDCDGTLQAGIARAAGIEDVQLELADQAGDGKLHRRPHEPCWKPELAGEKQPSRSTVSRDMLQGYMLGNWARGAEGLAALQRAADYLEAHDWVAGEPATEPGAVLILPNQMGQIARAIYVLSDGADDRYYRRLAAVYPDVTEDFGQHLQALGIYLQGQVNAQYGLALHIDGLMLDRLHDLVQEHPDDYLFRAVLGLYTGDQSKTIDLLLGPGVPVPTYIRGDNPEAYALAHWLLAAKIVLDSYEVSP